MSAAVGLKALAIVHGGKAYRAGIRRSASVATILTELEDGTGCEIEDDWIDDIAASWQIGWDVEEKRERDGT